MKLFRKLAVAFSLYSRIPMPHFEWTEEDMKQNLLFLPWVGAVIGGVSYLLYFICTGHMMEGFRLPDVAIVTLLTAVPLLVTGGFHVDGYMDTQDALKSYKGKEEKLEILKDPHIGAFAVIRLALYGLIWVFSLEIALLWKEEDPGVCLMGKENMALIYAVSFIMLRAVGGLTSLSFPHARKDGMLNMETKTADGICKLGLLIEAGICIVCVSLFGSWITAMLILAGLTGYTLYYRLLCERAFGGVTGDTTGFFITGGEGMLLLLLAVSKILQVMI